MKRKLVLCILCLLMSITVSCSTAGKFAEDNIETDSLVATETVEGEADWLYATGNKITDKNGKEVWITGVSWAGYEMGRNVFSGCWEIDIDNALHDIANHGFNLLRIPISKELLHAWQTGEYPEPDIKTWPVNVNLDGLNSLEIFDHVVEQCDKIGIKIMMVIDDTECSIDNNGNVEYSHGFTEEDYIGTLCWLVERYKNNDTIVAYDLEEGPHGQAGDKKRAIWNDSDDKYNWKRVAQETALSVLDINPNVLCMIEGVEIYPINLQTNSDYHSTDPSDYYTVCWGGNLRGVKDYPIELGKYQDKIVYSPIDFGITIYEQSCDDKDCTYESLYENCWKDNWFYIQEDNIAPLLIGEWGGFMKEPELSWMKYFRRFIIENRINHTFWSYTPDSADTGGLLNDNMEWDLEKYEFVKKTLWQKDGKFVGLDHDTPLGGNGISLSQY